jgi:hypothetical protein
MNPGDLRKSLMFQFKHATSSTLKQRPPGFVIYNLPYPPLKIPGVTKKGI